MITFNNNYVRGNISRLAPDGQIITDIKITPYMDESQAFLSLLN